MERPLGRSGMTLVEVVTALALMVMVAAAASAVLGFGLRAGLHMQAGACAEVVCGQVLDAAAKKLGQEASDTAEFYKALASGAEVEADCTWLETIYDGELYRGFSIEKLTFCLENPEKHPDVVRIDLTLRDERTGNMVMASDYVRLQKYCLYLDGDFGKIGIG